MSSVDSTCSKSCPLWSKYGDKCPNFVLTQWVADDSSIPKLLEDCAPKRAITMLMEIHNQLAGIKVYASQTRSRLDKLCDDTVEFMVLQRKDQEAIEQRTLRIEGVTKKIAVNLLEAKALTKKGKDGI